MLNRKGDLSILLLVLLIVVLCAFALGSFIVNYNKVEANIVGANSLDGAYSKGEKVEAYNSFALEDAVKSSYVETLNNQKVSSLNSLQEGFSKNVEVKFANYLSQYGDDKELDIQLSSLVKNKDYKLTYDDKGVNASLGSMVFMADYTSSSGMSIDAIYRPQVSSRILFYELGLPTFNEIFQAFSKCGGDKDKLKECLSKELPLLDVSINGSPPTSVVFGAKRGYLVNGQLNSLSFSISL